MFSRMVLASLLAVVLWPGSAGADTSRKLVCRGVNDHIIYFGPTIRLTLNMTQKTVRDDKGGRSSFTENDTTIKWTRNGEIFGTKVSWAFDLDRTTLELNVDAVTYQCEKDEPKL